MNVKLPTLKVNLPSNSLGYNPEEKVPTTITLQMMTTADSKLMSAAGNNANKMITSILDQCVVEDINVNKLYTSDRLFLFFMLRKISFGEKYPIQYVCECRHTNKIDKIIPDDFEIRVKGDATDPNSNSDFEAEVKLPLTKYIVKIKLLRGDAENKLYQNNLKDADSSLIERVTAHISSIRLPDGDTHEMYPQVKRIVESLPFRDLDVIQKGLEKIEFGLKTSDIHICEKCGLENDVSLSIDKNFFRMES